MINSKSYSYNLSHKFEEIISLYSNNIAIEYPEGKQYSFEQINVLANKLVNFFKTKGLVKGDVIVIVNEKSIISYTLMIASLKCGVIYCNADCNTPLQRFNKILTNCNPKLIFLDSNIQNQFEELHDKYQFIQSSFLKENIKGLSSEFEPINITGNSPAYIMFTSGSTGFPKGAVISHDNILNFIEWGRTTYEISSTDVFTNANPIYFDNSVFDFYISIFNGAKLVSISHQLVKKPHELLKTINNHKCTIWFSVPSLLVYLINLRLFRKSDLKTIRSIIFGGEGFPKNKLKSLFLLFGSNTNLYNVYGPTECTCICSSHKIQESDFDNMNELATLGYLSPNFDHVILSKDNNQSNFGELCLLGPCVGLGYYNDYERTKENFVQNTNSSWNNIMYKTGDLVKKDNLGKLHFRGRVDNQIKHMGYRIELEEIEAALSSLKYIKECGVIYKKISVDLGYIVGIIAVSKERDKDQVMKDLKKILPQYMLPKEIHFESVLQKNQNGKIDRKNLKNVYG